MMSRKAYQALKERGGKSTREEARMKRGSWKMRGPDGTGRDSFIYGPAAKGKIASDASKDMVKSTGWAGEKTMSFGKMRHWFPREQPVTQFQEERARRQAEVFARLYEDGKRVAEGPQSLLSFTQKDYHQHLALQPWNPWSPAQMSANIKHASKVSAFKRSTLLDKHLGGAGSLICMQQLGGSSSHSDSVIVTRESQHPDALKAEALTMTPRKTTKYFHLPSLDLSKTRNTESVINNSGSPRVPSVAHLKAAETTDQRGGGSGAQTARDMRKTAVAQPEDSIVQLLKRRITSVAQSDITGTGRGNGMSGSQTAR